MSLNKALNMKKFAAIALLLLTLCSLSSCTTSIMSQQKDNQRVTTTERKVFGLRYFYSQKTQPLPATKPLIKTDDHAGPVSE